MRLTEIESAVADAVDPPVTDEEVVAAVGHIVLESPHGVQETVEDVLARQGSETFDDASAIVSAVRANVRWEFVGRREYDDRSPNVGRSDHESF